MDVTACVRCGEDKPTDAFHWQVTIVNGRRVRSRDRTCKACRHEQKRLRDRARPRIVADDVIDRFLRLPVPR